MNEEQLLLHWMSKYGVIMREQAIRLLRHKPRETALKIVRSLQKQHRIHYMHGGHYLTTNPMNKPDLKLIDALWVLLLYTTQIGRMDHHPASHPSQIYFLRENTGYEIVVLREGEQKLPTLLQQENVKYIIVVPHEQMIREVQLPDAPVIFAILQYTSSPIPKVKFYTEENNK